MPITRWLSTIETIARWWLHPFRVGLLVALAWILRLVVLISAQTRGAEETLLVDDAFYYFRIAFNLTRGLGSTFDGLAPTNGYHPLWMLLLLPIFTLVQTARDGAVLAAGLGAAIWSIGGFVAAALARRILMSSLSALVFTLLYLFLPQLVLRSLDGLETSLVVVCYLLFFWWVARGVARPSRVFYAIHGALSGMLFLARTDAAVVIFPVSIGVWLSHLRACYSRRQCCADLALAGAVALLAVAPWLVWNWVTFGQIVQTSGTALSFLYQRYAAEVNFWGTPEFIQIGVNILLHVLAQHLFHAGLWIGEYPTQPWTAIVAALAYIGLLAAVIGFIWKRTRACQNLRWAALSVPTGFLLLVFVHTVVRWAPREWYYAPTILATYAGLLFAGEYLLRPLASYMLFALLGGLLVWYGRPWQWQGLYVSQVQTFEHLAGVDEVCFPQGARVGSSDAGIRSVLWNRVTLVNLDGLVNSQVVEAYRKREGLAYLDATGIDYIETRPALVQPIFWGEEIRLRLKPVYCGIYQSDLSDRNPYASLLFQVLRSEEEIISVHAPPDGTVSLGEIRDEKYLGFGWQPLNLPQPARRIISQTARLLLPLQAEEKPHSFSVIAHARGVPAEAHLEVRLNGERAGVVPLSSEPAQVDLSIPSSLLKNGINRLDFEVKGVRLPSIRPQKLPLWFHPGYFDPYQDPLPGWLDSYPAIYVHEVRIAPG
ncbi:MAG: hypothetical protein RMM31_09505 [Anaerolineae bacterium]|nr:hypothetical protein [Thermoflexales bacterium]MDW8396463.1 hypothetical protein [Anaerolineae bacterium]